MRLPCVVVRRERWALATVCDEDGAVLERRTIDGAGGPDLTTVDHVARIVLDARRRDATVTLSHLDERLDELLRLVGISVEVQR